MEKSLLLSDGFAEFSTKIALLHKAKKAKQEEMKIKYKEYEKEIASLDQEAEKLNESWEKWAAANKKKDEVEEKQ